MIFLVICISGNKSIIFFLPYVKTGNKRCGAAEHFLECYTSESKLHRLKIQLIESVNVSDNLLEQKSRQREKYWQAQLFTLTHG